MSKTTCYKLNSYVNYINVNELLSLELICIHVIKLMRFIILCVGFTLISNS